MGVCSGVLIFLGDAGGPQGRERGCPRRNTLVPHVYYRTKFYGSRSNHLGVRRGFQTFLDAPQNTLLPHMCYCTKFHCCRSRHFEVGMDSTKFWGRWDPAHRDVGVCDPRNMLLPPELPCEIRSLSVKPYERNYGDLPENFDPSHPAFQGPTRVDRLPMTSC